MPLPSYRIYQQQTNIRDQDSVIGHGIYVLDSAIFVVAKHEVKNPFAVFNEAVSVELGDCLKLPIVYGVPTTGFTVKNTEITKDDVFWASLSIGEALPPPDCDALVRDAENDASGVIVFDTWIANTDRHPNNFSYRQESRQLSIFDHGEAICGRSGVSWLANRRGNMDLIEKHAIAKSLKSIRLIPHWIDRVCKIHNEQILSAVERYASYLPDPTKAREIAQELILRKKMLHYMFSKATQGPAKNTFFPAVSNELDLIPDVCPEAKAGIDIEVPNDSSYEI